MQVCFLLAFGSLTVWLEREGGQLCSTSTMKDLVFSLVLHLSISVQKFLQKYDPPRVSSEAFLFCFDFFEGLVGTAEM